MAAAQATAGAHATAAGVSSLATTMVVYPLSNISIKMQVARAGDAVQYDGVLDALRKTAAEDGLAGLYAGVESALVGSVASNVCYYYWYSLFGRWLDLKPGAPMSRGFAVSALAGACNVLMTNPIWVANNRYITASAEEKAYYRRVGLVHLLRDIAAAEGTLGLMRGVVPAMVLVTNPIITYTVTERVKGAVLAVAKTRQLSAWQGFLVAAVSKLVATSMTHPLILIKSRLQKEAAAPAPAPAPGVGAKPPRRISADSVQTDGTVQSHSPRSSTDTSPSHPPSPAPRPVARRGSISDGALALVRRPTRAVREILREDGPAGLYRGLRSKVLQSVLQFALLYMLQDQISRAVLSALRRAAAKR